MLSASALGAASRWTSIDKAHVDDFRRRCVACRSDLDAIAAAISPAACLAPVRRWWWCHLCDSGNVPLQRTCVTCQHVTAIRARGIFPLWATGTEPDSWPTPTAPWPKRVRSFRVAPGHVRAQFVAIEKKNMTGAARAAVHKQRRIRLALSGQPVSTALRIFMGVGGGYLQAAEIDALSSVSQAVCGEVWRHKSRLAVRMASLAATAAGAAARKILLGMTSLRFVLDTYVAFELASWAPPTFPHAVPRRRWITHCLLLVSWSHCRFLQGTEDAPPGTGDLLRAHMTRHMAYGCASDIGAIMTACSQGSRVTHYG